MSESKHTPGPWSRVGTFVHALSDDGANQFCALVQDAHTPTQVLEANARLIAAAPELLEALQQTLAQCLAWQGEPNEYSCEIHSKIIRQARAAIAKALGEEL